MAASSNRNRTLIFALIAVGLVIVAVAVVVALTGGFGGAATPQVASAPTQDENTLRTQFAQEITQTALGLAAANAASFSQATIVALQVQSTVMAQQLTQQSQGQVVDSPVPPINATPATQQPPVLTATPQPGSGFVPTQAGGNGNSGTTGTCSRSGDEINVGANSTGACATVSEREITQIIQNAQTAAAAISQLDHICEQNVNACYQYRNSMPSVIPSSLQSSQRVLWGDTGFLLGTSLQDRIQRLKCDGNICIYLLTDAQPFGVANPGRGLLLDQPYH